MKIRSMNLWLVVLAATIVGYWTTASKSADEPVRVRVTTDLDGIPAGPQVPRAPAASAAPIPPVSPRIQQIQGPAEIAAKVIAGSRVRTSMAGGIRAAAEAVRDAKGEEARDDAKKALSELLGKCFDEDTKRREEELTQIEERLAKLRDLLDRRRAKKQDILDLQMKVALNEADGLGFYDSERSPGIKAGNLYFYNDFGASHDGGANPNPFASPTKSHAPGRVSGDRVREERKSKSESTSESKSSSSK